MNTYFTHFGERFTVTLLLLNMVEKNEIFYCENEKDNTK